MNAVDFILKEHEVIRKRLAENADDSHRFETKKGLFEELAIFLDCHEKMEQKKWYPVLKVHDELKEIISHLIEEEKEAAEKIKAIKKIESEDEWDRAFAKFTNDVEHHASEEEHKLFPKVRKLFEETELEKIGLELREFKLECMDK